VRRDMAMNAPILVVDDDALSRHVLVQRLRRWGYAPAGCAHADAALSRLRHFPETAALVADVDMPGTDGLALARAAHELRPEMPIFLMAPTADADLWARAAAAGARDLLVKQAGGGEGLRDALAAALGPERTENEDLALAHSLRTPLTALKGAIDMLCNGQLGELGEPQRRFAGIAQRNVDRMVTLVEELLDSAARP
jgi:DNA-binding NtrC family response regulator